MGVDGIGSGGGRPIRDVGAIDTPGVRSVAAEPSRGADGARAVGGPAGSPALEKLERGEIDLDHYLDARVEDAVRSISKGVSPRLTSISFVRRSAKSSRPIRCSSSWFAARPARYRPRAPNNSGSSSHDLTPWRASAVAAPTRSCRSTSLRASRADATRKWARSGAALTAVERLGIAIPESWVVVADVFRHAVHAGLPPGHDPASLLRTVQRPIGVERAARARARLLEVEFESNVERELDRAWVLFRRTRRGGSRSVRAPFSRTRDWRGPQVCRARSSRSSRAKNSATRSAEVWAAAASETTLHYLRMRRLRDVAISVVIQPVVVARATVTLVTDARALFSPPESGPDAGTRFAAGRPWARDGNERSVERGSRDLRRGRLGALDPSSVARSLSRRSRWRARRGPLRRRRPDSRRGTSRGARRTRAAASLRSARRSFDAIVPRGGPIWSSSTTVRAITSAIRASVRRKHCGAALRSTKRRPGRSRRSAITCSTRPLLERARRAFPRRSPRSGRLPRPFSRPSVVAAPTSTSPPCSSATAATRWTPSLASSSRPLNGRGSSGANRRGARRLLGPGCESLRSRPRSARSPTK